MKNSNENETHFFEEAEYQRVTVPSTQFLQASIIENAKQTPQHNDFDKRVSSPLASLLKFFSWPPSLFQSAVMLSFMFVFSGGMLFIGVGDQHQGADTDQNTAFEVFSGDDLDWQELMLIQDELLFAQI